MISSADLKFDKMDVDTTLAQNYIKKNNAEFHSIDGFKKTDQYMHDAANNKIYCTDLDFINTEMSHKKTKSLQNVLFLLKLAKSIKDNVKLFCQLEYHIRQKPIQTTEMELNMIMKYLRYQACMDPKKLTICQPLVMKNDSPLIDLGCFALLAPGYPIIAAENTAVVCHLFMELCRSAGSDAASLSFLKNEDIKFDCISKHKVLDGGCIGVVTTQSDVESAVDVFLSAPKGDLWGIRRILVQESVCERFRAEFAWKTRAGSQSDIDPQLKSLCTDLYVYDDKIYLREYGGGDTQRNVVLIESFRTVKELLTLIECYQPFCVSLWSHGVSESNEIAFGITAPMVWVNRYGTVGFPRQVSLAYYCHMNLSACENNPEMEKVRKLQKDWAKLKTAERRKTVLEVLPINDKVDFYVQCICTAESYSKNFTYVGDGDMVIAVSKPRDVYAIDWMSGSWKAGAIIHRLCNGSGFLIKSNKTDDDFINFVSMTAKAGLPIQLENFLFPADDFSLPDTTRVIHSTFGTIFAN